MWRQQQGGNCGGNLSGFALPAPSLFLRLTPSMERASRSPADPLRLDLLSFPPHPLPCLAIRCSFCSIKTMQLHASWKALFALITTVNEAGDRNVAGFTGAMDLKASLNIKMTKLVQPFGLLLAANNKKEIAILHHPHNFGGTLLCLSNKVGCLIGVGPSTILVVLDHKGALCSIKAIVPPITDIVSCITVDDLATLPPPPPNIDGNGVAAYGGQTSKNDDGIPPDGVQNGGCCRRGKCNNTANGDSNKSPPARQCCCRRWRHRRCWQGRCQPYSTLVLHPRPFSLQRGPRCGLPPPLMLIVATRVAREAHVHAHDGGLWNHVLIMIQNPLCPTLLAPKRCFKVGSGFFMLQKLRLMARRGKGCGGNDKRSSQNGSARLLEALSVLGVNQRKRDGAGRANPERFPPQFPHCCCLHITKEL
jgi:hypothetical protein